MSSSVASVNSDEDVYSLLEKASAALSIQRQQHSKPTTTQPTLISTTDGVAKLDPAILVSQTDQTVAERAIEKVSFLERRNEEDTLYM